MDFEQLTQFLYDLVPVNLNKIPFLSELASYEKWEYKVVERIKWDNACESVLIDPRHYVNVRWYEFLGYSLVNIVIKQMVSISFWVQGSHVEYMYKRSEPFTNWTLSQMFANGLLCARSILNARDTAVREKKKKKQIKILVLMDRIEIINKLAKTKESCKKIHLCNIYGYIILS